MNASIVLRKAKLGDMEHLQNLAIETVRSIGPSAYSAKQVAAWVKGLENRTRFRHIFDNQFIILAEKQSELLGFGTLDDLATIDLFYVHWRFQRVGVGKKILNMIIDEAVKRNYNTVQAYVSKPAFLFFSNNQFEPIKVHTNLRYGVEIENYLMKRNIDY